MPTPIFGLLSAIKAVLAEKPPEALDEQWIWLLDDVTVTTRDYVNVFNRRLVARLINYGGR